jgi:hypothetical protein
VKTPRPTEGLTLKHLFQWFQPFNPSIRALRYSGDFIGRRRSPA